MPKKYLHATLNQEPGVATYTGTTSDSVKITVDNTNRTIRGDVIWKAALGEDSKTAYPGDKGRENRLSIEQLKEDLSNEISRAESSRKSTEQLVTMMWNNLSSLDNELRNEVKLTDEKIRRVENKIKSVDESVTVLYQNDADILTQLQTEHDERITQFEALQCKVDEIDNINSELARVHSQVISNDKDVKNELSLQQSRITEHEKRLNDVEQHVSVLPPAVKDLEVNVTQLRKDQVAEQEARKNFDDSLTRLIVSEINRSERADRNLSNEIQLTNSQIRSIEHNVQQVVEELLQVDFIDGGTAPI